MLDKQFWKDRKVFLTGHTGFKGSWLALWLTKLGAKVYGYSLPPNTEPSMYKLCNIPAYIAGNLYGDIRDSEFLAAFIKQLKPSVIIHLAAQPLVRDSYLNPINTFSTNIMGTLNILEASRNIDSLQIIEIITTDKCYKIYKNDSYTENDVLGGDQDPYSTSKACVELITKSYRESFLKNKTVITARAGNVIGGGDWAKDRLITDALISIKDNKSLLLRNPYAIRPWQHVLDVIYGYLLLIESSIKSESFSGAWNFGPSNTNITVVECIDKFFNYYGCGSWEIDTDTETKFKETQILQLNCTKAKQRLGWEPRLNLDESIKLTVDWYKSLSLSEDMYKITMDQISDYSK